MMSKSRLISTFGLVILCQISATLSSESVPVLISAEELNGSERPAHHFQDISKDDFVRLLEKNVGGSRRPILVFAKDDLCIEELSQQKSQLQKSGPFIYYPSVHSPVIALRNLDGYKVFEEENPELVGDGQIIIVPITDLNAIAEILKNVQERSENVIVVITGLACSYSRSERTRRAVASRAETEIIFYVDRVLFYSSAGIYAKFSEDDSFITLGQPKSTAVVADETYGIRIDMAFSPNSTSVPEVTLRLQFSVLTSGYWYFDHVEYEANSTSLNLTSNSAVYFPFNFSYHCAEKTIFSSGVTYINFTDIQVQIDPTKTNDSVKFSDGYDCIGFTSVPIWSGIFVTAILALIMIWGLTMILDIRTMDRFDDPKGKTITIAASE